jgi:polar amino acid transport system substrate-binding protein
LLASLFVTVALSAATVCADDAGMKELAPTGKLRLGLALGATVGAGNVMMDAATGKPRGVAVRSRERAGAETRRPGRVRHLSEFRRAHRCGGQQCLVIPVDEERKKRVAFGSPHIVLQSTYLVAPGSSIQTLAEADRPGVRVVGIENTATARAAQASLKNIKLSYVKTADELFESLKSGNADAIVQSRESLVGLSNKLPNSRVLDGGFLNSFVAVAVPKNKPAARSYASAFVEEAKATGRVRRALDDAGLKSSVVAPAGPIPRGN